MPSSNDASTIWIGSPATVESVFRRSRVASDILSLHLICESDILESESKLGPGWGDEDFGGAEGAVAAVDSESKLGEPLSEGEDREEDEGERAWWLWVW